MCWNGDWCGLHVRMETVVLVLLGLLISAGIVCVGVQRPSVCVCVREELIAEVCVLQMAPE